VGFFIFQEHFCNKFFKQASILISSNITRISGKNKLPAFLSLQTEYLKRHEQRRKYQVQQFFYGCPCICCGWDLFTKPFLSNENFQNRESRITKKMTEEMEYSTMLIPEPTPRQDPEPSSSSDISHNLSH
jgi:hypothetical protein